MRKLFVAVFLGCLLAPAWVQAQISVGDTGLGATGSPIYGTPPSIGTYIAQYIVTPAFGAIGIVFFFFMVYAGFLWMTAAGNDTQVTKARQILTNSFFGMLIMVIAYAVTRYLVRALSGL